MHSTFIVYLPTSAHCGASTQTAALLKTLNFEADGGTGLVGFGGTSSFTSSSVDLEKYPPAYRNMRIPTKQTTNTAATIHFCFFVKLQQRKWLIFNRKQISQNSFYMLEIDVETAGKNLS